MRSAIRGLRSGARAGNEIFEKSEMKDWSDVLRFKRTRCLRGLWAAEKLKWKEIAKSDPPLNDSRGSGAPLGAIFQDYRLSSLNFHASVARGREESKFLASKKFLYSHPVLFIFLTAHPFSNPFVPPFVDGVAGLRLAFFMQIVISSL